MTLSQSYLEFGFRRVPNGHGPLLLHGCQFERIRRIVREHTGFSRTEFEEPFNPGDASALFDQSRVSEGPVGDGRVKFDVFMVHAEALGLLMS